MKWNRISDHCIQSGSYTITKALVKGVTRYTLWDGDRQVAIRDSAEELKKMAEEKSNEFALQEG